jgi:hypothetical protein
VAQSFTRKAAIDAVCEVVASCNLPGITTSALNNDDLGQDLR